MKISSLIGYILVVFVLLSSDICFGGKCTGSANCKACRTCSSCQHCNGGGGSCGICGGGENNSKSSFYKKDTEKQSTHSNWLPWSIVALLGGFILFKSFKKHD